MTIMTINVTINITIDMTKCDYKYDNYDYYNYD